MGGGAAMTFTRTHTTYFDTKLVDEVMREAYAKLESSYLERKEHITPRARVAIEARLDLLRSTWTVLLDRNPE
jgi:hypothetical protein